jgi:broad specificity phosphatase PhoE
MTESQHLLLVRHGETVGNREQIAHGRSESPLNDRGIAQAQLTAELLNGWERSYDRVYASPLSRAHDTAKAIAEKLGLPLSLHTGLMESHLGILEGVPYEKLDSFGYARRSIEDDNFTGHEGESPRQVGDRMEQALAEIRALHPGENLILVSHGGALAHLMARIVKSRGPAFGPKYIMFNSAISEIVIPAHGDPELIVLNHHEHLPEELKIDPTKRGQHADK